MALQVTLKEPEYSLQNDIILRSIKIIDIGYIYIIYFVLGLFFALLCDRIAGVFNPLEHDNKSIIRLLFEIIGVLWLYGVITYIIRNLIPLLGFPLNNIRGYDHLIVKELQSAAIFSLSFLYFQDYYTAKINYVRRRIIPPPVAES